MLFRRIRGGIHDFTAHAHTFPGRSAIHWPVPWEVLFRETYFEVRVVEPGDFKLFCPKVAKKYRVTSEPPSCPDLDRRSQWFCCASVSFNYSRFELLVW